MPLVIKNEFRVDAHVVLDWFIDRYLPVSSGDDAKVYLYLLRIASKSTNVSSNEICKKLGISEQTMILDIGRILDLFVLTSPKNIDCQALRLLYQKIRRYCKQLELVQMNRMGRLPVYLKKK